MGLFRKMNILLYNKIRIGVEHIVMVLYFVSKLKLLSTKTVKHQNVVAKNRVHLLCYSEDDSTAWSMVKEQAKKYMTKKNEKICDQTVGDEDPNSTSSNVKEMYVIRDAKKQDDKVNTIEVYKQWREKIKGYTPFTYSYKDREVKIAEFSIAKFTADIQCGRCTGVVETEKKPDIDTIKTVLKTIKSIDPKLLKELKANEFFRDRIKQVEKYSRIDIEEGEFDI